MVTVRDGCREDAQALARMISDFNVEEGSPGRITAEGVEDLCFRDHSLYKPLVAEDERNLVGYALIKSYFDTDPCAWCSYMQDLYVVPERRSQNVGRRLITTAARQTLDQGRHELTWHVRDHNHRGRAFYAGIGGREDMIVPVVLSGEALKRLAKRG